MWTRDTETPPPEERLNVPPNTTGQFDLWDWRRRFVLDYLAPPALTMLHDQPEAVAVAVLRDFHYNDEGYTREISLLALTDLPGASVSAVRLLCPQAWDGADGQGDAADSLPDIGSVDPREPGHPGPPGNDPAAPPQPGWWAALDDEPEGGSCHIYEGDYPQPDDLASFIRYDLQNVRQYAMDRILQERRLELPEELAGMLSWGGEGWCVIALLIRQPEARALLLRWVVEPD